MNDIDINSEEWPEEVIRMILFKSNQWDCSPNEALRRILKERAKRLLPAAKKTEEMAIS